jgi:hypothetical protein
MDHDEVCRSATRAIGRNISPRFLPEVVADVTRGRDDAPPLQGADDIEVYGTYEATVGKIPFTESASGSARRKNDGVQTVSKGSSAFMNGHTPSTTLVSSRKCNTQLGPCVEDNGIPWLKADPG